MTSSLLESLTREKQRRNLKAHPYPGQLLYLLGLGRERARGQTRAKVMAHEGRRKAKRQIDAWVRNTNASNRSSSNSVITIHMLPIKTLN